MPKRGTKVKDLAADLGVTSRDLIDRCRAEGIPVQNRISKLDASSVQKIRSWFPPQQASAPDPQSE